MELVVSWGLTDREITLETRWTNFCKPQSNEVRVKSDLRTSFRQGNKINLFSIKYKKKSVFCGINCNN